MSIIRNFFGLFLILLVFSTYAGSEETVFLKIKERLSYMQDVALYKVQHQIAIEDKVREKVVLDKAISYADQNGIASQSVAEFFKAQIKAAKAIQYRYLADLQSNPKANEQQPRDLKKVIRPALIDLGNDILQAMIETLNHDGFDESQRKAFNQTLQNAYLTEADKNQLFDALLKIKLK